MNDKLRETWSRGTNRRLPQAVNVIPSLPNILVGPKSEFSISAGDFAYVIQGTVYKVLTGRKKCSYRVQKLRGPLCEIRR